MPAAPAGPATATNQPHTAPRQRYAVFNLPPHVRIGRIAWMGKSALHAASSSAELSVVNACRCPLVPDARADGIGAVATNTVGRVVDRCHSGFLASTHIPPAQKDMS